MCDNNHKPTVGQMKTNYTKEEFIMAGVRSGYATKDEAKDFCKHYPDDHIFTEDDFIPLYRAGYGHETENSNKRRYVVYGMGIGAVKTTKRFAHFGDYKGEYDE